MEIIVTVILVLLLGSILILMVIPSFAGIFTHFIFFSTNKSSAIGALKTFRSRYEKNIIINIYINILNVIKVQIATSKPTCTYSTHIGKGEIT